MQPLLSVIIPCYNSGAFLQEALDSISDCNDTTAYNIIIVDDGSTDEYTLNLLDRLKGQKPVEIIHQSNKGASAARNTGVRISKSKYILLLDSDNKLRSGYMDKAVQVMEQQPGIGVVYGNAVFFGDTTAPRFVNQQYNIITLLKSNYIDMCSVVKKEVWDSLGGLDESLLALEDWDFWIRVGASGWGFHYINETLFDYRVRNNSLVMRETENEKFEKTASYIYAKHQNLIWQYYEEMYAQTQIFQNDQEAPFKTFVKYFYNKYFKKNRNQRLTSFPSKNA